MVCNLIGPNLSLLFDKNNPKFALFSSDGKLGQYVINTHELAMGALCLLAASLAPLAASVALSVIGALVIYDSINAYNAGMKGEFKAGVNFVWNSIFG